MFEHKKDTRTVYTKYYIIPSQSIYYELYKETLKDIKLF